jgi:adenylosuccinate synthase
MAVIAVVGGQWGDEGKGKIIDLLAGSAQVVIRAQGGDNAGHTVVNPRGKFALHLVPAGIFNPQTLCIIGAGVALNPQILLEEMDALHARGVETSSLIVSERTHLVMPYHLTLDRAEEHERGAMKLGTTGRGIGPAYSDKVGRVGLRASDLLDEQLFGTRLHAAVATKNRFLERMYGTEPLDCAAIFEQYRAIADRLRPHIQDAGPYLDRALAANDTILIEGAHGTLLDLDYGSYPYVTTSSPTIAGLLLGAGIGPRHLTIGLGVFKAYQTRVGAGPMPTELHDSVGEAIRRAGQEYGTTTGRPRRCGWFDVVAARHAVRVNGFDYLAITRLDILDEQPVVKLCVGYDLDGRQIDHFPGSVAILERCRPIYEELDGWQSSTSQASSWADLPLAARAYLDRIGELLGVRVALIGVGQGREQTIKLDDLQISDSVAVLPQSKKPRRLPAKSRS